MAMNAEALAAILAEARSLLDGINERALCARLEALDTPLRSPTLDGQGGASLTAATAKGDHPTHSDAVWNAASQRNPDWSDPKRRTRPPAEISEAFREATNVRNALKRLHEIDAKTINENPRNGPCTICSRDAKRLNEGLICDQCVNARRVAFKRSVDRLNAWVQARADGDLKAPKPEPWDDERWRSKSRLWHATRAAKSADYRRLRELRKRKAS